MLIDRLTHGEDPTISLHAWQAALNEYARGKLTKGQIKTAFDVDSGDTQGLAMIGLIDAETGTTSKLLKSWEINDVLIIHANSKSRSIYPNKESIVTRLLG